MTSALTRRGLVTAAPAAVIATALPALATVATVAATQQAFAETGDAHLFELGLRLESFKALAAEADRKLSAVEASYNKAVPHKPEALVVRPDDKLTMKKQPEVRAGQPTGRFEYDVNIEEAQKHLASWSKYEPEEIRRVAPEIDAALVRLREIVDSQAAWRDACRATWAAAGMPEAEGAVEEAHERCNEVIDKITEAAASTLEGVIFKARLAEEDSFNTDLRESIVADLVAMGGAHA